MIVMLSKGGGEVLGLSITDADTDGSIWCSVDVDSLFSFNVLSSLCIVDILSLRLKISSRKSAISPGLDDNDGVLILSSVLSPVL